MPTPDDRPITEEEMGKDTTWELLKEILAEMKKQTAILEGFRGRKQPTMEEMMEQGKKIAEAMMPKAAGPHLEKGS